MPTYTVRSMGALSTLLERHSKARQERIYKAMERTARQGVKIVQKNVPVAFSELRDSVHAKGFKIVADAPHAAGVENGTRPHWPDIDKLEKWVKLRAAQGLINPRSRARLPGTTTRQHAGSIAAWVSSHTNRRGSIPLSVPRRIAMAIAKKIAKHGTKPKRFMQKSQPQIMALLDQNVKRALER